MRKCCVSTPAARLCSSGPFRNLIDYPPTARVRSDICSGSSRRLSSSPCFRDAGLPKYGQHTPTADGLCKYAPTSTRICALLCPVYVENALPLRLAAAAGTVTHERQRDSDGLAAISGEVAANVAQAQ